ncbi:TetR family transcriptional regulator C-terminal domain-containing protein [Chryseobacterium wangxinyae]|uniref:TetR family transcriptional regulator C-terminal domain-containing protein n=1 Tax=Chryseobacterium sp. CY353 TaxID=2997334 RepID=UPI0022719957|nr:TetR family transcriptional regulator C-terminal domain-containing protein [Chryseobacterium sp. CY353]MCY0970479.1 TetR family transcriptional regulator C-terminal domain-containing protein [Chryseobacterium sp. CY353]
MENNNTITEERIFELYSDYILNHGERPKNIYRFAKDNEFEEKDFYEYFASFEHIERRILQEIFVKSVDLAATVNENQGTHSKEKVLNVYYIFFENLTMNRSLVLMLLGKNMLHNSKILTPLRETHRNFIKTLDFNDWEIIKNAKSDVRNFNDKAREEIFWLHLLSSIDFWRKDTSPAFEKTDVFIEKTIDTGFEIMDSQPLKKVADLGKFLWKEKFKKD